MIWSAYTEVDTRDVNGRILLSKLLGKLLFDNHSIGKFGHSVVDLVVHYNIKVQPIGFFNLLVYFIYLFLFMAESLTSKKEWLDNINIKL